MMTTRTGIAAPAIAAAVMMGVTGTVTPGAPAQTRDRDARKPALHSTIAFVSTRHDPAGGLAKAAEIYLMNEDGTNQRRLTENAYGDVLPALSPDGTTIVFDSNRLRTEGQALNVSHLFVMNIDGSEQTALLRGSSATWSPDSRNIAFHASASGASAPTRVEPGAPTADSDIFVMNVSDFRNKSGRPGNITNSEAAIDEDADWSPDGRQIVFTSRAVIADQPNATNNPSAEIYLIDASGTGKAVRLTNNTEEERAPAWSPDGTRILFVARRGGRDFELCVMNADGTGQVQLTDNTTGDLTSSWSPDGRRIVFHRVMSPGRFQLWLINADGTGEVQLTDTPGLNGFPNWRGVRGPGSPK